MAGIGYWESPGNSPKPIHDRGTERDVAQSPITWRPYLNNTIKVETLQSFPETSQDNADDNNVTEFACELLSDEEENEIIDLDSDLELQSLPTPTPDAMAGIGYWESPGNSPTPIHDRGAERDVAPTAEVTHTIDKLSQLGMFSQSTTTSSGQTSKKDHAKEETNRYHTNAFVYKFDPMHNKGKNGRLGIVEIFRSEADGTSRVHLS